MVAYFLDTYAMMEIVKGNHQYQRYLSERLATSLMNLYELYYLILKSHDEKTAKEVFSRFQDTAVEVRHEHIFLAAQFRLDHQKLGFSYVDALGYAISLANGMRFLTGDRAFREMEHVEFVA